MENFINVDKNMIVNTTIGDVDVKWYDVRKAPFSVHGLYKPETEPFFHRMPFDVAAATSEAVERLQQESAGGSCAFFNRFSIHSNTCKVSGGRSLTTSYTRFNFGF